MNNKRIQPRAISFEQASSIRSFFLLLAFLSTAIVVAGCSPNPEPGVQIEATTAPLATTTTEPTVTNSAAIEPESSPIPTNLPTITPTLEVNVELTEVTETAVAITPTSTATPIEVGKAWAGDDGKVYLAGEVIFDIQTEATFCYHDIPAELSYSPTSDHFLVIPFCIEGDNLIFIFQADGSGKREVTGPWDYLNGLNYEWSADGQSFIYERIDSCCLAQEDIPDDAPPRGMIQYDVVTGEKTMITPL